MKHLFAFLLLAALLSCNNKSEKTALLSQLELLQTERDSLMNLNNQLETQIDSINSIDNESNFWFNNRVEGKQLLDEGIDNPEEYIVNTLQQKPELIPLKPVLGGQMKFKKMKLLGKGCLIAYYEDGHISGKTIYSYRFINGKLSFEIVKTCSD